MRNHLYTIGYSYQLSSDDPNLIRSGFDFVPCYDLKEFNHYFWVIIEEGSEIIYIDMLIDNKVVVIYDKEKASLIG